MSQIVELDGIVLLQEPTSRAGAILAAAEEAGVPADAVLYSPIRNGYLVPTAVADALVEADKPAEKPAKKSAE